MNSIGIVGILMEFLEVYWNAWNSYGIVEILMELFEF